MMPLEKLKTAAVTSSQPPHSEQRRPLRSVPARGGVSHSPSHEREQRCRQQPGRLTAHQVVEEAQEAGLPLKPTPPAAAAAARAPTAEDPAEAVVAEDQVEDVVVGRAVDERARARRQQRDDRDPPPAAVTSIAAGRPRAGASRRRSPVGAATR
jgi:hypothetical protein